MFIKHLFFVLFIITFFSCKKHDIKQEAATIIDSTRTDIFKANHIIKLNTKAKNMVKDWIEYQKMDEFIQQYYHISIDDAMLNAKEFSKLSQQLKDSIRVEKLDIPSVKIRLNVLNNEVLRLMDMATITNISSSDIKKENKNILDAYFALNSKINNIIIQENLNSDVNKFIEEITSNKDSVISEKIVKLDTTLLIK
ncbi:MAG: hypothetical protein L3J34_09980 [Flavobacteriaceae bacterium]|nr:hypothetical protein [Flavobacteriaceae bacterium]